MPNQALISIAKTLGKDINVLEDLWTQAKKIAKEEYNTEDNYQIIMGIFKKSLGTTAIQKIGW